MSDPIPRADVREHVDMWEYLGVHPDDEYENDLHFCPVCCEEMDETTNEDGDYELVCSCCGYKEKY